VLFPDSHDGAYTIGPDVATDVDLFERRVAAVGKMPPERSVEILRGALELGRGPVVSRPSGASHSYAWIDAEICGHWCRRPQRVRFWA
jgi:hypothetical protein